MEYKSITTLSARVVNISVTGLNYFTTSCYK